MSADSSKLCSKCKRVKNKKRYFAPKKARSKKTGEIMYSSWCKKCKAEHNLKKSDNIPCMYCGKPHNPSFVACRSCVPAKERKKHPYKHKTPIDPKWLVRGNISHYNKACPISQEA